MFDTQSNVNCSLTFHFILDQTKSEIQNRDSLIEELTQDNESLRSELKQLRNDHEKLEQKMQDQEEILDQCQEKIAKLVVENDHLSSELKCKVDDLTTSKVSHRCFYKQRLHSRNFRLNWRKRIQFSGIRFKVYSWTLKTAKLFKRIL